MPQNVKYAAHILYKDIRLSKSSGDRWTSGRNKLRLSTGRHIQPLSLVQESAEMMVPVLSKEKRIFFFERWHFQGIRPEILMRKVPVSAGWCPISAELLFKESVNSRLRSIPFTSARGKKTHLK